MFPTIALTSYHDLPDLISVYTHIDRHLGMQEYDGNHTSSTNLFHYGGTQCSISEQYPLNAFKSIEWLLNPEVDDFTSPADFWEQLDVPSPWNMDWTEDTAYRGGLKLDDPVFRNSWTQYCATHAWFDCDPELPYKCGEHNCWETHLTQGLVPAAAATAKRLPIALIVIEPPTMTPSEIDSCIWLW